VPLTTPNPQDLCPAGPTGQVEIKLYDTGKRCAARPIPAICVERGNTLRFRVVNESCRLDPLKNAVRVGPPKPKSNQHPWQYGGCRPEFPGANTGALQVLDCKVPKSAEPGLYKFDLTGEQIEPVDPDVEVRKGG
jgi:hypothetical protein